MSTLMEMWWISGLVHLVIAVLLAFFGQWLKKVLIFPICLFSICNFSFFLFRNTLGIVTHSTTGMLALLAVSALIALFIAVLLLFNERAYFTVLGMYVGHLFLLNLAAFFFFDWTSKHFNFYLCLKLVVMLSFALLLNWKKKKTIAVLTLLAGVYFLVLVKK